MTRRPWQRASAPASSLAGAPSSRPPPPPRHRARAWSARRTTSKSGVASSRARAGGCVADGYALYCARPGLARELLDVDALLASDRVRTIKDHGRTTVAVVACNDEAQVFERFLDASAGRIAET